MYSQCMWCLHVRHMCAFAEQHVMNICGSVWFGARLQWQHVVSIQRVRRRHLHFSTHARLTLRVCALATLVPMHIRCFTGWVWLQCHVLSEELMPTRCAWGLSMRLQARAMKRAQDVRKQLIAIMDRYKLDLVSAGKNYVRICKAITSGFFFHAARKDPQEVRGVSGGGVVGA